MVSGVRGRWRRKTLEAGKMSQPVLAAALLGRQCSAGSRYMHTHTGEDAVIIDTHTVVMQQ